MLHRERIRIRVSHAHTDLLPKQRPKVFVRLATKELLEKYQPFQTDIATLASTEEVVFLLGAEAAPAGCAVSILDQHTEVHMLLVGMVNPDDEIARLVRVRCASPCVAHRRVQEKARAKAQSELAALQKRMSGAQYDKVPKDVQEKNKQTVAALNEELRRIAEAIEGMKKLKPAA